MYSNATVIIPTLNESKNIEKLIRKIEELCPDINIIVADDGSSDGTREIVNEYNLKNSKVRLLDRSQKNIHGLAASVVDAINIVDTKYIIVMDGDLQHPPEKLGDIIKSLENGNDLVIATRKKVIVPWPFHRKLMSKIATTLAKMRLVLKGIHLEDPLSGFFGIRTELMKKCIEKKVSFELRGYKILFDVLKVAPKNVKVYEIYYSFGSRMGGNSKINSKIIFYYIHSLFR